jgi:hypothetical protein
MLFQIRETDFTSNVALQALLQHLHDIFVEVKCHEDIEDNIILERLQSRLKSLCVDNVAVCDCHSNNRVGKVSLTVVMFIISVQEVIHVAWQGHLVLFYYVYHGEMVFLDAGYTCHRMKLVFNECSSIPEPRTI